jgi:hypothetical protein
LRLELTELTEWQQQWRVSWQQWPTQMLVGLRQCYSVKVRPARSTAGPLA